MTKNKRKYLVSIPMTLAAMATPIAAVISCGSKETTKNNAATPSNNSSRAWTSTSSSFSDVVGGVIGTGQNAHAINKEFTSIDGTITSGVGPDRRLDPASGYNRQSEIDSPEKAGVLQERMARIDKGMPTYPNMDAGDIWNWSPEGASIEQSATQAQAFATTHQIPNANGNNWDWGFSQNNFWWQPRDWKYTRATRPEIAPITYGEKLKPTQSPYAPFSYYTSTARNANIHMGIMDKSEGYSISDFWTYTKYMPVAGTSSQEWIQIPDGNIIDSAHKHGTYSLGNVNWTGRYTLNLALRKDENGEYPFVKSLVNIADFYGFDGWIFDNEFHRRDGKTTLAGTGTASSTDPQTVAAIAELTKAYLRYARDVNPHPTSTGLTEAIYNKYHFKHRPQMLSIYPFPADRTMWNMADLHFHSQSKGGHAINPTAELATIAPSWQIPDLYDSSKGEEPKVVQRVGGDVMSFTDGYNPGEGPGLADLQKAAKNHINASQVGKAFPNLEGEAAKHTFENREGTWMWLYTEEDTGIIDSKFSSVVGDPRYSALIKRSRVMDVSKTSLSDAFQEKSAITGRQPWGTTFSSGKGEAFNLWGGADLKAYVNRAENGWRHQGFQSFTPTYKWIVDEFDANGRQTTDFTRLNDEGNHVDRNIEPTISSTSKDNWLGGSTLRYNGTLAKKGMSFENKLYASSIPVESGDKFKVYVKNGNVVPELLTWTHDGKVPTHSAYQNGNGYDEWATETPWGEELYNRGIVNYASEKVWNVSREKHAIKPASCTPLGNSGWSQVEYDLSSLDGKTIMDLGIKATAPRNNFNFANNLVVGKMAFEPKGYDTDSEQSKIKVTNVNTDFVWNVGNSLAARVSWDADKRANTYMTFKADENWNVQNLTWLDARPSAYVDHIAKTSETQNLVIIALDDAYNIVSTNKVTIKTGVTHA